MRNQRARRRERRRTRQSEHATLRSFYPNDCCNNSHDQNLTMKYTIPPHDQGRNQLDVYMCICVNMNEEKGRDLLRSLRNSERSKSLAELGWGSGRLLESLTRMDSEDWKMQRRKPRTNVKPIDFIQRCSACSIFR